MSNPYPASDPPIVLYHYHASPYARRVVWYLRLRGIPYVQCPQPPVLPRPDVARLGIRYRRIPLLSIGRDVYLDTRLILQKLEQLHPSGSRPRLGADPGTDALAVERLLEVLHVDSLFFSAAALIPTDLPWAKDPKFQADRADFFGPRKLKAAPSDPRARQAAQAEALARRAENVGEIRRAFELLETTLLADGRDWLLRNPGGGGPSLADIEALWPLHWLLGLPGALPPDAISAQHFPRTFAWIARFDRALAAAGETDAKGRPAPAPRTAGADAQMAIVNAPYNETALGVDTKDPLVKVLGLEKGQKVVVWPTDSGVNHKDTGRLVGIDAREIVIETLAGSEKETVRVHAPRHGFRVRPAGEREGKL